MKIGDQKQAVILSVVAVGAIGFLVLQLKGKGGSVAALNGSGAANTTSPSHTLADIPTTLYGDPFSNAVLIKQDETKKPPDKATPKSGPPNTKLHVDATDGGYAPEDPDIMGAIGPKLPGATADGDGKKSLRQGPEVPKPPELELEGIVSAGHPQAFIAINGGSPIAFRQGSAIAPGVVLKKIYDNKIDLTIAGHKKTATLTVGSKLQP